MSRKNRLAVRAAARSQAMVFAALGDPRRLQLLGRLSRGEPCSISELSRTAEVSRQAITRHLGVLAGAGLVHSERLGRETRFQFDPTPLAATQDYLGTVAQQWEDALGRLKKFVEG